MYRNEHLGLDVGQANELKLALRRFDWDNSLIKRLCEGDVLGDALDILRGDAQVVPVRRVINLSTAPVLEEGHSIVKHLKHGKEKLWDKTRLVVMSPDDLQYTYIHSHYHNVGLKPWEWTSLKLNRRTMIPNFLKGQRPANICMRDFLFENPHLIPRDWRFSSKPILFWGTICHSRHCEYVPGLSLSYGKWEKYGRAIDSSKHRDLIPSDYDNPCVVFAPALPN